MKHKTNRAVLTTLRRPTANELNGAFAHHIANFKHVGLEWESGPKYWRHDRPCDDGKGRLMTGVPDYCGDFDQVVPFLDGTPVTITNRRCREWRVVIMQSGHHAEAKTPARAAVIALLRNAGITVIT